MLFQFSKFTTTLSLSDPSLNKKRRENGATIGDDICGSDFKTQFLIPDTFGTNFRYLKTKVKAPFVGPKSKKFPTGLEVS